MDGQFAAVLVICLIAEQIEKLRVDHGDQEVEGTVGITDVYKRQGQRCVNQTGSSSDSAS